MLLQEIRWDYKRAVVSKQFQKNVNNEIIEETEYEKYNSKKVKEEKKDEEEPYFTPSPSPERDE